MQLGGERKNKKANQAGTTAGTKIVFCFSSSIYAVGKQSHSFIIYNH